MKSQREVERKYNRLLEDVKTKEFFKIDLTNRVNCYTCQTCGHITKTKDVDAGVTPFMHTCESCGQTAYSSFYKDIAPHLKPTQEWYRPTLERVLKMRRNSNLLDHILHGGLDVREIEDKQHTGDR